MSSGAPASTTTTSQVTLSPEQRKILNLAMPNLQEFATKPASEVIPQYSQVAGFTPNQTAGQNLALSAVPGMQGVTGSAAQGSQFLTSGQALDPASNPALRGITDTAIAATRGTVDNLLTKALPAIRSGAQLAGPFGGSRQGIAEGLALRGGEQAVADAARQISTDVGLKGYTSGLDAMKSALLTAPATATALTLPGQTVSGVGDVQQAMNQALLSEQYGKDVATATYPLTLGQQYAGIAGAIPGGGSTSTSTAAPAQTNPLLQALGVGASLLPLMFAV